jgi:mannose-6-phosphate isomerase-like protein (cupin superfamily)
MYILGYMNPPIIQRENGQNPLKVVEKAWGREVHLINIEYCGKLLIFNPNSKFSMHYHMIKDEAWFVQQGTFIFRWIDTKNAKIIEQTLNEGDCVRIERGLPHQLETIEGGTIFEVSTKDYPEDSYRVLPGTGQ